MIIDGRQIAARWNEQLKQDVARLHASGIVPKLAVIYVGENPASASYIKGKLKRATEIGIEASCIRLGVDVSERELVAKIEELNRDIGVHGILVQLPLPSHIAVAAVIEAIDPSKDVDGFHPYNLGAMLLGQDGFVPCTPGGIIRLLRDELKIEIAGKHAVVIGRSHIVGKPLSVLLQQADATVTMCHSRTLDLPSYTRQADILLVAVGRPQFITADYVRPGTIVIDVGINRIGDKLVGDVAYDEVASLAAAITPVPGGVGPLTISMLLSNTIKAAHKAVQL